LDHIALDYDKIIFLTMKRQVNFTASWLVASMCMLLAIDYANLVSFHVRIAFQEWMPLGIASVCVAHQLTVWTNAPVQTPNENSCGGTCGAGVNRPSVSAKGAVTDWTLRYVVLKPVVSDDFFQAFSSAHHSPSLPSSSSYQHTTVFEPAGTSVSPASVTT